MNWRLIVDDDARKSLKRIPKNDSERIARVIESLAFNPYAGDIEKMKGEKDVWRRRLGSYRLVYEIHQSKKVIYIFAVERRTSTTY